MTFLARRDFPALQERLNRIFRESFGPESPEQTLTDSNVATPVDVYEDEHNITLKIEVPGIDEKDINVTIENNTLTVRGERRFEKDEEEENFHRVERMYGSFTRSFTLPNTVDPEQVSAHYEKGVLKIRLATKAEATPTLIKVHVEKTLEAKCTGKVACSGERLRTF